MHQSRTLVVLSHDGLSTEPYFGSSSTAEAQIFARHPEESALALDLRIRDGLRHLRDSGTGFERAVLLFRGNEEQRVMLRRLTLLSRYLPSGATLVVGCVGAEACQHILELTLEQLKLRGVGTSLHIELETFQEAGLGLAPNAPLTAAWQRIQRQRYRRAPISGFVPQLDELHAVAG